MDKNNNNQLKPFPLPEALKLRFIDGLTVTELAEKYHVTQGAISQRINNFLPIISNPELIQSFIENRGNLLAGLQLSCLNSITPKKLKRTSVRDAVVSAGILYDKERLERNLSTSNVAMQGTLDLVQARSTAPVYRSNNHNSVGIISTENDK